MRKLNFVKIGAARDESPQDIMRDAADPTIPALEVLARAEMRSKSGALLKAVEEKIRERPLITGSL
jgi:hypothetical protein